MRQTVRTIDSVFRLAGDEFTVLPEDMTPAYGDARAVAHKLVERIAMPIDICGDSATVGASVGIALFTPGSDTPAADLIKEADRWMYEARKGAGVRFARPWRASGDSS
jgi:diguanylate cyclase (GGDEF)-like protein